MKRIIAILLTVLLLGMLTACDQNVGRHADGIIKADKATFEIGKTHSSFEGMNIQIANAIWDDEEIKLDVNWINKTGYDVVYGSSYTFIPLFKRTERFTFYYVVFNFKNSLGF